MATNVFTTPKLWLDGYDLSAHHSALALQYGAESLDVTAFGNTTRVKKGGLKTVTFGHAGFWDETPDKQYFDRIGVANTVMSVGPLTGAEAEVAYSCRVLTGSYQPGAAVGEMLAFSVTGEASAETLVRGAVLRSATLTANNNGTAQQLGSVSAAQSLYASLHITAVSGSSPSMTIKVQSDNASGFPSSADRITFTAATAIGAQWAAPVAGSITDDWWRINTTITGTTPSFTFVVVVSIQ